MIHDSSSWPAAPRTMGVENTKFVRFQNELSDLESDRSFGRDHTGARMNMRWSAGGSSRWSWLRGSQGLWRFGQSVKHSVSRVFSEDHDAAKAKILDPRSNIVQNWNKLFLVSTICAVFIDPLFLFLPVVSPETCIKIQTNLAIVVTVLRTITDTLYLIHMFLQFRTAFIAPSSRVFGRGELVVDSRAIARRYLTKDFWLDLIAVLPLPQVVIWIIIPAMKGATADNTKNALRVVVIVQYFPRFYRIFPLTAELQRTVGVVMKTAWAGAAYNLVMYILASHIISALYYLLSIERQDTCWQRQCRLEQSACDRTFLDCSTSNEQQRVAWFRTSNITLACDGKTNDFFDFGIYADALSHGINMETNFLQKYFYCLWWGLRNLGALGQNLATSTFLGEVFFAIFIGLSGLILFALLIGNVQTYLQSLTVRTEEMRVKRRDTEQWMRHRQLPFELRERVRKYDQYRWLATRGVDEDVLLQSLPLDLRRDIKRHLCYDLVRRVPLFDQMDEQLLDAMCERLKPALFTVGTYVVREGDPVNSMLFIIRGHLESVTTNGGRTGFLNVGRLNPGDFCGEELLTWALDPKPSKTLPSSTRTVKALVEVEAFSLLAEDLKFVAGQFRRLHSKQLQLTFRYYSQQWRTWAACFIQAAWRRYQRRRLASMRRQEEEAYLNEAMQGSERLQTSSMGAAMLASRFAAKGMRGVQRLRSMRAAELGSHISTFAKPDEPDFSLDDDE